MTRRNAAAFITRAALLGSRGDFCAPVRFLSSTSLLKICFALENSKFETIALDLYKLVQKFEKSQKLLGIILYNAEG